MKNQSDEDMGTSEFLVIEADGISKMFEATFGNLALCLQEDYEAAVQPLDAEQESLARERSEIEEEAARLETLFEPQQRVTNLQADMAKLNGQPEEAEAKLNELEDGRRKIASARERQREIDRRCLELETAKQDAARRVALEWWSQCRVVTLAAERGFLITLLGGLEQSLAEFRQNHSVSEYSYELDEGARLSNLLSDDSEVHGVGTSLYRESFPVRVRATGARR